jgi:aryl-alcohol dehydrogenase-like predicted oxidoreductase
LGWSRGALSVAGCSAASTDVTPACQKGSRYATDAIPTSGGDSIPFTTWWNSLSSLAQAKNCTMVQLALAWVLQQPGITGPNIGPRTMEQLVEFLGAPSVTIEQSDRDQIDRLLPPGGMVSPFYEAEFGPHPMRVT